MRDVRGGGVRMDRPIITTQDMEAVIEPMAYECKFTVESKGNVGGDWERNIGGFAEDKRVTFDGYASAALIDALIDAIGKVADA